ncbi:MAG: large conductance mechanosensitive channel protein MscL [Proteobacteria bacterium]|nr:large conductance mechanosensitive channel protein MscL [Pseudomonadota bacterium]
MRDDFRRFAMRGNVVDLAVGFTVGAAFSTIAKSLVDDLIMPPIGMALGEVDFSDFFVVLREGALAAPPYATLAAARDAGAVTLNYGIFINHLVAFLLIALAMFALVRLVNRLDEKLEAEFGDVLGDSEPTHKKCPDCLSTVLAQARRCSQCTSWLVDPPPE